MSELIDLNTGERKADGWFDDWTLGELYGALNVLHLLGTSTRVRGTALELVGDMRKMAEDRIRSFGSYTCGCALKDSGKMEAFCPVHLKTIPILDTQDNDEHRNVDDPE